MSKCKFYKCISMAYANVEWDLYPEDFPDCETLEELQDAVVEYFNENIDSGDFMIDESDYECILSEEFINGWKKLKQNEI